MDHFMVGGGLGIIGLLLLQVYDYLRFHSSRRSPISTMQVIILGAGSSFFSAGVAFLLVGIVRSL